MKPSTSIADIAADAGVSVTTVSHALSGNRHVSEATRRRIRESVERLGYRPNMVARSLRLQRTHMVALLVVDISNHHPAQARAVIDTLSAKEYITFIGNTEGDAATERKLLEEAAARNVDGIIMQPMALGAGELREIAGRTPFVLNGRARGALVADMVFTEDAHGMDEAVHHVLSTGRTDIAFISGPVNREPGPGRLAAFRRAAASAGVAVPDVRIAHAPFTRDGGYRAGVELLSAASGSRPDAVLCVNDVVAIGFMRAAQEAGLRIPDDIAVVGFDNIDTASLLSPQLTTVDVAAPEVGAASARALLQRMAEGLDAPYRSVALPTRLVVRQSA